MNIFNFILNLKPYSLHNPCEGYNSKGVPFQEKIERRQNRDENNEMNTDASDSDNEKKRLVKLIVRMKRKMKAITKDEE